MLHDIIGFYRGKRVLVTGHTGFKGSWLAIWLKELGAHVIGLSLDPEDARGNFNVTGLKDKVIDVRADIREIETVRRLFEQYHPEIVFHLAAQSLVGKSYDEPLLTYQTNVLGTANVLEAARVTPSVAAIVNVTSDKSYKNKEWVWGYRENDELGGKDPYSSSKACSEIVTRAYWDSFFQPIGDRRGVGICTTRAGNVIGGGDCAENRIVPDCINALERGEPIRVRNPSSVRPWQHVMDPLYGYLLLGQRLGSEPTEYGGAWNFGPKQDSAVAVKELVESIIRYWGKGEWVDVSTAVSFVESRLLRLDNSKARYRLGWVPQIDVEEAVKLTVEGYQASADVYDQRVNQIAGYMELVEHDRS